MIRLVVAPDDAAAIRLVSVRVCCVHQGIAVAGRVPDLWDRGSYS
jgi:hypothetical protein